MKEEGKMTRNFLGKFLACSSRHSQPNKRGKNLGHKKGAIESEMLGWWIMGIAILVILGIGLFLIFGKGENAIAYVKNLMRFGRA